MVYFVMMIAIVVLTKYRQIFQDTQAIPRPSWEPKILFALGRIARTKPKPATAQSSAPSGELLNRTGQKHPNKICSSYLKVFWLLAPVWSTQASFGDASRLLHQALLITVSLALASMPFAGPRRNRVTVGPCRPMMSYDATVCSAEQQNNIKHIINAHKDYKGI